jgi:calcineurin-like phosphoesterase family protein
MLSSKVWMTSKVLRIVRMGALATLLLTVAAQVRAQSGSPNPKSGQGQGHQNDSQPVRSDQTFTLVGAGDIATCKHLGSALATAKLIEQIPGTVFAAGDLAYEKGSPEEFKNCYDSTWGRFKDRTKPALGNHEYSDHTATGYFQYWGAQAGPAGKGFYSYDLGVWHIVVLNTNCGVRGLGGCEKDSPQETWLRADLAKHRDACILAYGHHALFSSGVFKSHALHPQLRPLWEDLYAAHADLILAGHEHSYERFAPQDPEGNPDPAHGIREIVVGTGGRSHAPLGVPTPNSEVRDWKTYGVLKLTLIPGKYTWEFIPAEVESFHDSGSGVCHNGLPASASAVK